MKKRKASAEACDKMSQTDAKEVWNTNCRWCGKTEGGTMADLREAAKKHGPGKCREVKDGA